MVEIVVAVRDYVVKLINLVMEPTVFEIVESYLVLDKDVVGII